MQAYQDVFQRYEKKYLVTQQQYDQLSRGFGAAHGARPLCAFLDPQYLLRHPGLSADPPLARPPPYKEKLRLRTYGTPAADSEVFLEIKKKFDHIVYKRRIGMPYAQAVAYLDGRRAAGHTQIAQEIEWFRAFYRDLRPAMFIYYDRFAIVDREQPDLRITFDSHIRWRADRLDLSAGTDGAPLLAPGHLPDGDQDPAGGAVLAVARAERGGHFPDALL